MVYAAEPIASSSTTEVPRPRRLSINGSTSDAAEGAHEAVWNDARRFSDADVLSEDRRPATVDRRNQLDSGRGRAQTRASIVPPVVQMSQRRPSQPTAARARQPLGDCARQSGRRFSDNSAAAGGGRQRRYDLDASAPATTSASRLLTAELNRRLQSLQSNPLPPPATGRNPQRAAVRRSSEGRGVTAVDTWWTRAARRQSSSLADRQTEPRQQTERQTQPSAHNRKRRSAPEVAFTRSQRRASASSSGREMTTELDRSETSRRKRWNTTIMRLADDSFDSVLTSGLPSPTASIASDYSSAASLSDIPRGWRKDSGFRSIDTQSSYGASRKNSAGGLRRQSFQTAAVDTGRHHSIPFVANPFELPGRLSSRPPAAGPRSSGRRQSMFTRSDELGGTDGDWMNEWLHWRSGCAEGNETELPDFARDARRKADAGVWNSLSEKVEHTFVGFDRVISRATALLHERRVSADSATHIDC